MTTTAPHLREDLLTPRLYTTDLAKAARTDLQEQRPAFEAMLQEMETDYNRDHFDRKAPLDRLRDLDPEQKGRLRELPGALLRVGILGFPAVQGTLTPADQGRSRRAGPPVQPDGPR
jgi:hypothetical protein